MSEHYGPAIGEAAAATLRPSTAAFLAQAALLLLRAFAILLLIAPLTLAMALLLR